MSMSRLLRKHRTAVDLGLKGHGGITDAFDDMIKSLYRINDKEYDYICENCSDEELDLILNEERKFSKIKQTLIVIENTLSRMRL